MSFERLRTDFRFAIFVLFCAVAIAGVTPFAVYRFASGATLAGIVDTLIVLCIAAGLVHVWRGGPMERPAVAVMVATAVGCAAIGHLIGLAGALWSYPCVIAFFLLLERRLALAVSGGLILALVIEGNAFRSEVERWMYLASAGMACLFAWVFAYRTHTQRLELERQATIDPLTGAANRRAMEDELHIAAETYRRHGMPMGVAVMDLDHFKRINDEAGHEAGDEVLVRFTRIVQARCRSGDRLFRYGGEEFVLLLPATDEAALQRLLDDLRREVGAQLRSADRGVTVSIGAAVLQRGESVHDWLGRADAAMYDAKHLGRDRVLVAKGALQPKPVRIASH